MKFVFYNAVLRTPEGGIHLNEMSVAKLIYLYTIIRATSIDCVGKEGKKKTEFALPSDGSIEMSPKMLQLILFCVVH